MIIAMRARGYSRSNAQSVSEYGLPLILIIVVGLTTVSMFSQQFKSGLASMLGSSVSQGSVTLAPLGSKKTAASLVSATTVKAAGTTAPAGNAATTQANTILPNIQIPQNTAQAIETMGANGYTNLLSDYLLAYAQQLVQQGKISAAQGSVLIDLANSGHTIASVEATIQQLAKNSNNNVSTFVNSTATFNNQVMTSQDLSFLIDGGGIDYVPGNDSSVYTSPASLANYQLNNNGTVGNSVLLNNFISLYQQANKNGSLSDPTVNQLISNLSFQIAVTSDAVANTAQNFTSVGKGALQNITLDNFSQHSAAAAASTTSNAVVICLTGSGTDKNNNCSL